MSQYATRAELISVGLSARAIEEIDGGKQDEFLLSASGKIDTYMRGRYKLPITGELEPVNSFPRELRDAAIAIARYELLVFRGASPGEVELYKEAHAFYLGDPMKGTKGWLDKLAAGAVSINAASDATPTTYEGAAVVAHGSRRGWDDAAQVTQFGELESSFWRRDV